MMNEPVLLYDRAGYSCIDKRLRLRGYAGPIPWVVFQYPPR